MGLGDCIVIPGALSKSGAIKPHSQCANRVGLITAQAANTAAGKKTVCCKVLANFAISSQCFICVFLYS